MIQANGTIGRATWAAVIVATCSVHAGSSLELPQAGVVPLRSIQHDAKAGTVTLSWESEPGKRYVIEESANPELGWEENITNISEYSRHPIMTVLPLPGHLGAKTLLFRVREVEQETKGAESDLSALKESREAGRLERTSTETKLASQIWSGVTAGNKVLVNPPSSHGAFSPIIKSPAAGGA